MSAVTLWSERPRGGPARRPGAVGTEGALDVAVDAGGLYARRQRAPLRLFCPRAAPGDPPVGAVANLSGGVLGGDRLAVTVEARADALVTAQAAEKVYRSAGATARVRTVLTVRDGAALEWLPQATILFDGARLDRGLTIRAAPGGRCLAGEILVFGRIGMGETLARGAVCEGWRVECAGRPLWIDRLRLDGADGGIAARLAAADGFAGVRGLATAVYAGGDAPRRLDFARAACAGAGRGLRAAATLVNGVLVVRWLGRDPAGVRAAFGEFWRAFRAEALGRPPRLPVLWHV